MLQLNEWKKNCIAITLHGDLVSGLKPYYVNTLRKIAVQQPDFNSIEEAEEWLSNESSPPADMINKGFSKLVWAKNIKEALKSALPTLTTKFTEISNDKHQHS